MSKTVGFEKVSNLGVVTINNPPVNAINQQVRLGLEQIFSKEQPEVSAIVLCCTGKTFCSGADIKEFDNPIEDPSYQHVFKLIENYKIPVIAVMHGTVLGAGLELALACHYRCALDGTRLGLPEVSLGIIPGAGGTQRLPRIIGAKAALEFIFGIKPIAASDALDLNLLDEVIYSDTPSGGLEYASSLVERELPIRRTADIAVDATGFSEEFINDARKRVEKVARGQHAPDLVIQSIKNAISMSFEEGIKAEKQIGEKSLVSDEAKALRHIFFAERKVSQVPGASPSGEIIDIDNVGIIGSGTMGGGIAMNFLNIGVPVTIVDVSESALDKGIDVISRNYQISVDRGRVSKSQMEERMGLIKKSTLYESISQCDLVIEAVFEDIELKKTIFHNLDKLCKPDSILATNTSTLDVDEIAASTNRPEKVLGLHFFSPANVMKLLEIVRGNKTSPETLASGLNLAKKIKKVGVVAGVCFGFIGNRMMIEGFHREADHLLLEGASPSQIDRVMYEFGFPMGPFAMHDMAGVDIMHSILSAEDKKKQYPEPFFNVLYQVGESGRFGQKTGKGFYLYEKGSRSPIHDPIIDKLIENESNKLGIERREVKDSEIEERCMYALINEGARILEEEISYRSSDIDVIWNYGYGFPRLRGGPMYMADKIGLSNIHATILNYNKEYGDNWEPAKLLTQLAGVNGSFSDWSPG